MTEIKAGRKAADVKLFVAMPALDGRMHCVTTGSMWDSLLAMIQAGLPHTPHISYAMQDSNLPFARNRTLAEFMATDCSDLIFIDNDMSWDTTSWLRLICHPVDIVGAAYRKKIQDPVTGNLAVSYALDFLDPDEHGNFNGSDPETGLLEVKRLPAGFLRITRNAAQRMINECDVPEYEHKTPDGRKLTVHRLFSNDWNGQEDVGEDYVFCDRWRAIGGKVWCDPELKVHHHGLVSFRGHLGGYMRELIAARPMMEAAE
jgi:hypothetical protein